MKEQWTITHEDAEVVMNILALYMAENYDSLHAESVKSVHAALMWADRIEIDG